MFSYKTASAIAFSSLLCFTACKKEDPIVPNEEEVITTLTYTLTPLDGGNAIELKFQDLDGDGGDAPIITGGTLMANQTYNGSLDLLNETESPAESITEELILEAEEHQFFFEPSSASNLSVIYDDSDADGHPVGLLTKVTTSDAANATLTITLRHEPNKTANGVADGDITNAGGETDIEVTFPVDVQ